MKRHRKREHPSEIAWREIGSALASLPLSDEKIESAEASSTLASSMTPQRLKRVLNHMAASNAPYAYSLMLQIWFHEHGICWPPGFFRYDPTSPGSGGKPKLAKRELGAAAFVQQHIHKLGPDAEKIEERLQNPETRAAAVEQIGRTLDELLASEDVLGPSELAKKLIPQEYSSNRDTARKKIEEALELARPNVKRIAMEVEFEMHSQGLKLFLMGLL